MVKQFRRYLTPCMLLTGLLILIFALSACGSDSSSTPATNSGGAATSSGATTSSSASSAPAQTVNVKESKASGQPDVYKCDPLSITIKKGDNIQFTNLTDEIQDFDQGDGQKAGVDLRLDLNQSSAVAFNTTGTFTLTSEKGATITVIVQ